MNSALQTTAAPIKDIGLILKDLLKVVKVVSMYPENNPLPQSLRRSFAEKLVGLVEGYGELRISVEKEQLNFNHEVVFRDSSKEERLAGIFFDAGITYFTFKDGLGVGDIDALLEALKRYLNSGDRSLDLAGMLWESGINAFTFGTLEDVALSQYDGNFRVQEFSAGSDTGKVRRAVFGTEGIEEYQSIFDAGFESSGVNLEEGADTDGGEHLPADAALYIEYRTVGPGMAPVTVLDQEGSDPIALKTTVAAAAMGFDDLSARPPTLADTTLILNDEFKLSAEEAGTISQIVAEDAQFDEYESTVVLLQEILHQETEITGFSEAVAICEKLLSEYVQAGKLIHARQLLGHMRQLENDLATNKPLWAERLKEACITAGSRDRLGILAEALNRHGELSTGEVTRYLEVFDWHALSGVADMIGRVEHSQHREALCNFLARQGRENIEIISRGLFDKQWQVVCNAITIVAQAGDDRSLEHLKRAVENEDTRVRLHLVRALQDCRNDKAMTILTLLVKDTDKKIRSAAIDAIVAKPGRAAFEAVSTLIRAADFRQLDQEGQGSLLEAFSVLGGESAVPFLSEIILKRNFLGGKIPAQFRAAAFAALSHNRSDAAEKLLIRLSGSWRPGVKRQATEALAERRKIIYGGN